MGYEFELEQATYNNVITVSRPLSLWLQGRNRGIAPIYIACHAVAGYFAADGTLTQAVWLDAIAAKAWRPEASFVSSTTVGRPPALPAGIYSLRLELLGARDLDAATIRFANAALGADGRLPLGPLEVR
jgi:hypothetical protein